MILRSTYRKWCWHVQRFNRRLVVPLGKGILVQTDCSYQDGTTSVLFRLQGTTDLRGMGHNCCRLPYSHVKTTTRFYTPHVPSRDMIKTFCKHLVFNKVLFLNFYIHRSVLALYVYDVFVLFCTSSSTYSYLYI